MGGQTDQSQRSSVHVLEKCTDEAILSILFTLGGHLVMAREQEIRARAHGVLPGERES